jgi:hypothetical protein
MLAHARAFLVCNLTILTVVGLGASQFPPPPGWQWITDSDARRVSSLDPPEGGWLFGTMAPGWHVTTGPGAVLFEPSYSARGRFVVESESFLFPGKSDAGFGVIVGGTALDAAPQYVAFLIRRDGSAAVERVADGRATLLHPWTRAASIAPGTPKDSVKNVIRVEAEAASAAFFVNGEKVAEVPRSGALFDGVVGLRVGPQLNLHVTNLDLTHRLALPRASK